MSEFEHEKTNISSGNTIEAEQKKLISEKSKKFKIRSRNVIMTVQKEGEKNLNDIIKNIENKKHFRYILITKHDGPSVEHYHIYAQFENPTTLKSDDMYNAHFEKSYGSAQQCIDYLKCEDKKHKKLGVKYELIYEKGEPKKKGGRIRDIEEMDEEEIKDLPITYYNIAMKIKQKQKEAALIDEWLRNKNIDVEWHYGQSGSGKTYFAKTVGQDYRRENKEVALADLDNNGFWHVIGNLEEAELLIINEFRDSSLSYKKFLEVLAGEHIYNVKGGSIYPKNLKHIIITTQQKPTEIYKNIKETRNQIYRRIHTTFYHFVNPMIDGKFCYSIVPTYEFEEEPNIDEMNSEETN